jgi:hypothetical protein
VHDLYSIKNVSYNMMMYVYCVCTKPAASIEKLVQKQTKKQTANGKNWFSTCLWPTRRWRNFYPSAPKLGPRPRRESHRKRLDSTSGRAGRRLAG